MKQEEQKYYTLKDIINVALSKYSSSKGKSEEGKEMDMSMNSLSDTTYLNIWNTFTKWCKDITASNSVIEVPQFGEMFYFGEKSQEGIHMKLSRYYLNQYKLTWDDELSTYDSYFVNKYPGDKPKTEKINFSSIAKEMNQKPFLIQNSLFNLFYSIGDILFSNTSCIIDLGDLGTIYLSNGKVLQFPSKNKEGKSQSEMKPRTPFKTKETWMVPFNKQNWKIKDMMGITFKRVYIPKAKVNPILFNDYSNTKAAPFTEEKTQIPLAHRIGSFYSLAIQDYSIDKTTKCIKRLSDPYFVNYLKLKFDIPATDEEEYLYCINKDAVDKEKIDKKWKAYERYQKFIKESIPNSFIAEIDFNWLVEITKRCKGYGVIKTNTGEGELNYALSDFQPLFDKSVEEIRRGYVYSMKSAIMNYMLKHPAQKEKLNIPIEFKTIKEYAEQKVSRPSDNNSNWKTHWNRDKLAISNNLYIMCENATKIMKYYSKKVKNTSYVVLETDLSNPTKKLATFQDNQNKAIERQKEDVVEEWNKYVANILRQQKIYKDQLILYFKSISGMMSCQLRNLIMNSANNFYEYIQEFKKEKYQTGEEILKDQFNPDTPFEKSFLEVDVIESDDLTAFELSENQGKIKEAMIKTLTDIIDCSKGIGRPFNTFIKQIEKHENLWEISTGDEVVNQMIKGIEQVVEENLNVIYKVTDLYQPFVFAMKEKENLKEFVQRTEPKITRDEVRDKIAGYEAKLKELSKMPEILYMNMVKINCGGINQIIRNKLTDSVNYLLKFIREANLVKAGKELQEKVSEMFSVTERQITTENDVNKSEKDLDTYQDYKKKYFDTYNEIIEWLFFYLTYDTYNLWGLPKEEQSNSKINSFDIIKKLHEYINRVDKTLNDFNDKINTEKTKLLNKLTDEKKIFLQKVDLFKKELERFRGDLKQQRKSMGNKEKGSNYTRFFELLLDYKTTAENFDTEFKILDEKEVLLTGGNFEDESTKQCLKLLEPIIAYFRFEEDYLNEYKKINETEIICLKLDDLTEIVKRDTVYDNEGSRLSGVYKDVSTDKKKYEDRFRTPYNVFKLLYPLIEINKKRLPEYQGEELTGDDNDQLEDNALYFHEIVQIISDKYKNQKPEENQDMVIHLRYKDLTKDLSDFHLLLEKTEDVQPIMEEWQYVSQMYIDKKNIRNDFSKEFIIEKYKGKEFQIIQEENLNENLEILRKIIEITKEKLSLFREETMNKIRVVENFYKYKETAENILGVLIKIKEKQSFITEILDKPQILKSINKTRSGELFRRAQTNYKHMMEMLDIEGKDILALYTKKKEFDSEIEELSKILKEIQIQS